MLQMHIIKVYVRKHRDGRNHFLFHLVFKELIEFVNNVREGREVSLSALVRFNCEINQTCHRDHWKNSDHTYEYLEIGHVPLSNKISNP